MPAFIVFIYLGSIACKGSVLPDDAEYKNFFIHQSHDVSSKISGEVRGQEAGQARESGTGIKHWSAIEILKGKWYFCHLNEKDKYNIQ